MTRIIINDASCLIDLLKGRLLHAMLALPFEFVIPHPVRHSELLTLGEGIARSIGSDGGHGSSSSGHRVALVVGFGSRYAVTENCSWRSEARGVRAARGRPSWANATMAFSARDGGGPLCAYYRLRVPMWLRDVGRTSDGFACKWASDQMARIIAQKG